MNFEKLNHLGKNVSKTVTKTYKAATEKSGKLIEEAKLRLQIASENDKISEKLEEIGAIVYEDYKSGESNYTSFEDLCKEIEESELAVSTMNAKILEMKKLKQCPICENVVGRNDKYCSKCGAEQEVTEEPEEEEEPLEKCPYCDSKLAANATFCSNCGTKLNESEETSADKE
ncbi:MAG: zinc ribbon domain-containing protein [Clostridia bacterium]|nr:zinc ribbon domain-containing protein [Clostridia bacterium]